MQRQRGFSQTSRLPRYFMRSEPDGSSILDLNQSFSYFGGSGLICFSRTVFQFGFVNLIEKFFKM